MSRLFVFVGFCIGAGWGSPRAIAQTSPIETQREEGWEKLTSDSAGSDESILGFLKFWLGEDGLGSAANWIRERLEEQSHVPKETLAAGRFFAAIDETSLAVEVLEKGLERTPNEPSLTALLGRVEAASGNVAAAAKALNQLLDLAEEGNSAVLTEALTIGGLIGGNGSSATQAAERAIRLAIQQTPLPANLITLLRGNIALHRILPEVTAFIEDQGESDLSPRERLPWLLLRWQSMTMRGDEGWIGAFTEAVVLLSESANDEMVTNDPDLQRLLSTAANHHLLSGGEPAKLLENSKALASNAEAALSVAFVLIEHGCLPEAGTLLDEVDAAYGSKSSTRHLRRKLGQAVPEPNVEPVTLAPVPPPQPKTQTEKPEWRQETTEWPTQRSPRLARWFDLWQKYPDDTELALEFLKEHLSAGHWEQAWWLMVATDDRLSEKTERVAWWRAAIEASRTRISGADLLSRLRVRCRLAKDEANEDWEVLAELERSVGAGEFAMREAARLNPTDGALALQLGRAPMSRDRSMEAALTALRWMDTPWRSQALLLLLESEARSEDWESAEQTAAELAGTGSFANPDEALLGTMWLMNLLGTDEALALLRRCRDVQPNEDRLVYLEAVLLKESGSSQRAVDAFLGLAMVANRSTRRPNLLSEGAWQALNDGESTPAVVDKAVESPLRMAMLSWRQFAQNGNAALLSIARAQSEQAYRERGFSLEMLHYLLPPTPETSKLWGMANLLELAQAMEAEERETLQERANQAGYENSEFLAVGRIVAQQHREEAIRNVIELDKDACAARMEEPSIAILWLAEILNQHPPGHPIGPDLESLDAGLLQRCHTALLPVDPAAAMSAALLEWTQAPASESAAGRVVSAMKAIKGDAIFPARSLRRTLAYLPDEDRRMAAEAVASELLRWSSLDGDADRISVGLCQLLLSEWEAGAQTLDRALSSPETSTPRLEERTHQTRVWMQPSNGFPLPWPDLDHATRRFGLVDSKLGLLLDGLRDSTLPVSPALHGPPEPFQFSAAEDHLTQPKLKLVWAMMAGDPSNLRDASLAWVTAEPGRLQAIAIRAAVAFHQHQRTEAISLLQNASESLESEDDQLTAAALCLGSLIYPPSSQVDPFSAAVQVKPPTDEAELELARALATRIIAALPEDNKPNWGYMWSNLLTLLGLDELADTLKRAEPAQSKASIWRRLAEAPGRGRELFEWGGQSRGTDPRRIGELLTQRQRDRAMVLLQHELRRTGAARMSNSHLGNPRPSPYENWHALLKAQNLIGPLMETAVMGDTFKLTQAGGVIAVAEACGDWPMVIELADHALETFQDNPTLHAVRLHAELRQGTIPKDLHTQIQPLGIKLSQSVWRTLIGEARHSTELAFRNDVAEVVVVGLGESIELENRADLQATLGSILNELNSILTQSFQSGQKAIPALFSSPHPTETAVTNPPGEPVADPELERRVALHHDLCRLILANPVIMARVGGARFLEDRFLAKNDPSVDELVEWAKSSIDPSSPHAVDPLHLFGHSGGSFRSFDERMRWVRLQMAVIDAATDAKRTGPARYSLDRIAKTLGDKIEVPGIKPFYPLWEWPYDITEGPNTFTDEQLRWNKERRNLFEEFDQWARNKPGYLTQVLPLSLGYQFHGKDTQKWFDLIPEIKDSPGVSQVIQSFCLIAETSYSNSHHILSAEWVAQMIESSKMDLTKPDLAEPLGKLVVLLLDGRANQSTKMPSIFIPPDAETDAAGIERLPDDLEERRQTVFKRLTGQFGDIIPLPISYQFARLENALRSDAETRHIEGQIITLAESRADEVEKQLIDFIRRSYGDPGPKQQGQGGVWLIPDRNRWFASAMRLGKPLLKAQINEGNSRQGWLSQWITNLCWPPPEMSYSPPVIPISRPDEWTPTSEERLYELLEGAQERDQMLFDALDLAATLPEVREKQLNRIIDYTITRNPPRIGDALEALRATRDNGDDIHLAFQHTALWLQLAVGTQTTRDAAWKILRTLAGEWPMSDSSGARQIVSALRDSLLGQKSVASKYKPVPLLIGAPTERYPAQNTDFDLAYADSRIQRERWLEIVNLAPDNAATAQVVFKDFARVHLIDDPASVVRVARTLPPNELVQNIRQIFEKDEYRAPVARRTAWVELAVKIFDTGSTDPSLKGHHDSSWFAAALKYLQTNPESSTNQGVPPLPAPTADDLRKRNALLEKLMGSGGPDPKLEIERLVTRAEEDFLKGTPAKEVGDRVAKLAGSDVGRLSAVLDDWIRAVRSQKTEVRKKLWMSEVLAVAAENWPDDLSQKLENWRSNAMNLLDVPREPMDQEFAQLRTQLLDRLHATSNEKTLGSDFVSYALRRATDDEGRSLVADRIIEALSLESKAIQPVLISLFPEQRPDFGSAVQPSSRLSLATELLTRWPKGQPNESLGWVKNALYSAGPSQSAFFSHSNGGMPYDRETNESLPPPYTLAPFAPRTTSECEKATHLLAMLKDRGVRTPWTVGLSLKLAVQPSLDPQEQTDALKADLATPPDDLPWQFLEESLSRPLSRFLGSSNYPAHFPSFSRSSEAIRHPVAQEKLEAAGILATALGEGWVPEGLRLRLKEAALNTLNEIAEKASVLELKPFPPSVNREEEAPRLEVEAAELMRRYMSGAGDLAGWTLVPEALGASITEGLSYKVNSTTIADQVLGALAKNPNLTSDLSNWASKQASLPSVEIAISAGEFALALASRWDESLPPPNWLVEFLLRWPIQYWRVGGGIETEGEAIARFMTERERIEPGLMASLARYPRCTHAEWFTVLGSSRSGPDLSAEQRLDLALRHLDAAPKGVHDRSAAEKWISPSRVPVLASEWESDDLFGEVTGLPLAVFLMDHGLAHESPEWIQTRCLPGLESAFQDDESITDLSLLVRLYTVADSDFVTAAAEWFAGRPAKTPRRLQPSGHPPFSHLRWVLRVVAQRGMDLTLDDWLAIVDAPSWQPQGGSMQKSWLPASAWLHWREHRGSRNLSADLDALFRALIGAAGNTPWAPEALTQSLSDSTSRSDSAFSLRPIIFRDRALSWAWDTLQHLMRQMDFFGPALEAAFLAGFDQVPGAMKQLLLGAKQEHLRSRRADALMPRFVSWGLLEADRFPHEHWLSDQDGFTPLWAMLEGVAKSDRQTLLTALESEETHPGAGSTLLQIGLLHSLETTLSPAEVDARLQPFADVLTRLPDPNATGLSQALRAVCPDLFGGGAPLPLTAVLPSPADSPAMIAIAAKWLEATPESLPIPAAGADHFDTAAADLIQLIKNGSSSSKRTLDAMLSVLGRCDWRSRVPKEADVVRWVRMNLARKIASVAYAAVTTRSYQGSRAARIQTGPNDQDRVRIADSVLRFLMVHHRLLSGAFSGTGKGGGLASHVLSKIFDDSAWDGHTQAEKLMAWVPSGHPADILLLIGSLKYQMSRLPAVVIMETREHLAGAAAKDARHAPLAAMWASVASEVLGQRLLDTALELDSPSLFDHLPAHATPEMRLMLAGVATPPRKLHLPLIADLAGDLSLDPPMPGDYWRRLSNYSPWLSMVDATAEMTDPMAVIGKALIQWISADPSAAGSADLKQTSFTLVDGFVMPALDLLEALNQKDIVDQLKPWVWSRLTPPLKRFLVEMVTDPAWAAATLPEYLDPAHEITNALRHGSSEQKPELTAAIHYAGREALKQVTDPRARQTLEFLMMALPDSASEPPPRNRATRIADFVQEVAAETSIDQVLLRDCVFNSVMTDGGLEDFLPILLIDSANQRWQSGAFRQPADFESSPRNLSMEFDTILLTALAKALYQDDPSDWTAFAKMIRGFAPIASSPNPATIRNTSIPTYLSSNSAPAERMMFTAARRLNAAVEDFMVREPVKLWSRLVPVLMECSPPLYDLNMDLMIQMVSTSIAALAKAGQLTAPDTEWPVSALDGQNRNYRTRTPARLWQATALASLPFEDRWMLITRAQDQPARHIAQDSLYRSLMAQAINSGILSLQEILNHLSTKPSLSSWRTPAAEADFLAATGKGDAALAWINATADSAGTSEPELLLMAKIALHLGDTSLMSRLLKISEPKPGGGRTITYASSKAVRLSLQSAVDHSP